MILNELGQLAAELRIQVHSRPWVSMLVTRDCHSVSLRYPLGDARAGREIGGGCPPTSSDIGL
jgi:hypothetical protein